MPRSFRRPSPRRWEFRNETPPTRWRVSCGRWPDRELLIVLDNCEHVLGAAARVVVVLAGQCRRVRILATSRERLDVPGEFVFPVLPLGLPEDGSVRAVAASEAGQPVRGPGTRGEPRVRADRG